MTRADLLRRAADSLGRPVPAHHLEYALRRRYVAPPRKRKDGWSDYTDRHLTQIVAYMRDRSRAAIIAAQRGDR